MKLEARVSVPVIKNLVSTLEKIAEEAVFRFSPDGLKINIVCANRFKMVDAWLQPMPLPRMSAKEILNSE